MARPLSGAALVLAVCAAQVLVQIGAYTWPALLPGYYQRWALDASQAGWITGVFYLAYVLAVPVLVTLTDRVDPRRVYLAGVSLTVLAHAGFALLAEGPWSALALRALAGVGWAGAYMTGLKLLADRVDERHMSRAVTGHAAGVGVAGALSFGVAGALGNSLGAPAAFAAAAAAAGLALLVALVLVPAADRAPASAGAAPLFDFRPVLANRPAMAYAAAYCVHTWEMSALRGWAVAFLAWALLADPHTGAGWLAPTLAATVMGLAGTAASVAGNEFAIRTGRARLVRIALWAGIACALAIGWLGALAYALAAAAVVVYACVIWLDSSSLTAGTAGSAAPERRGATLAVHSMLGYAGGFLGPVVFGTVLDACGGLSAGGWALAFAHLALLGIAGRMVFDALGPRPLAGDRR